MRWVFAFMLLAVSGAIFWSGVPRFVASILKAPAHAAVLAAHENKPLSSEEYARAAIYLEKAGRWENSAQLYSDLGFLLLLQASQTEPKELRQEIAAKAASYLQQSLQRSPSRPHPWVRLAFARAFEGDKASRITAPLEHSVRLAPYVGEIAITRLRLLLLSWDYLSPKLKRYAYKQVPFIWPYAGGELLEIARTTPHPEVIRFALRPFPGAPERLDQVLSMH